MKIQELEDLARDGKLILEKRPWRVVYREKGWRGQKWEGETNPSWDTTLIKYQMYYYSARIADMPDNQFYKITKSDFIKLSNIAN